MKKKALLLSQLVALAVGLLFFTPASAGLYPSLPEYSYVTLEDNEFLRYIADQSPGEPKPNPVIGNNPVQHPGGLYWGDKNYFIGVFWRGIDTSNPETAIYLWETTGDTLHSDGPRIQLGYWDGTEFLAYGIPQAAKYRSTGLPVHFEFWEREFRGYLNASITPLSDFLIRPDFPFEINAVKIEVYDFSAHNQVTAVATNHLAHVPEPATLPLVAASLLTLLGFTLRQERQINNKS